MLEVLVARLILCLSLIWASLGSFRKKYFTRRIEKLEQDLKEDPLRFEKESNKNHLLTLLHLVVKGTYQKYHV